MQTTTEAFLFWAQKATKTHESVWKRRWTKPKPKLHWMKHAEVKGSTSTLCWRRRYPRTVTSLQNTVTCNAAQTRYEYRLYCNVYQKYICINLTNVIWKKNARIRIESLCTDNLSIYDAHGLHIAYSSGIIWENFKNVCLKTSYIGFCIIKIHLTVKRLFKKKKNFNIKTNLYFKCCYLHLINLYWKNCTVA